MAVDVDVNSNGCNDPRELFTNVVQKVVDAVDKALEKYTGDIVIKWQDMSDRSQVPGTFSTAWKDKKASLGFKREDLQRLGKGDNRSYYENITSKRFRSGRGWFVGVLKGTKAYTFGKRKPIVKNTKYSLAYIAKRLEEHKPIWRELHKRSPQMIFNHLHRELIEMLHEFGAGDAK